MNYDRYRPADGKGTAVDNNYFSASTGIYKTPAAGIYHCCASFRVREGGYADFTIIRNGNINFAAFGTRVTGRSGNGW